MIQINNLFSNENPNIKVAQTMGPICVMEYQKDLSLMPEEAQTAYFAALMNVHKRQVFINMRGPEGYILSAGAMKWMAGNIEMNTNVKGAGDLINKAFQGKATGESAIKPRYTGTGILALEPTFKHILITSVAEDWGGGVVLDDGLFLACMDTLQLRTEFRKNASSAVFGREGLANLLVHGQGLLVLESKCPVGEIVKYTLTDDVLKIDGNEALCWSATLNLTVERSSRSLLGSATSGEGLVNVYRGTGTVWMRN